MLQRRRDLGARTARNTRAFIQPKGIRVVQLRADKHWTRLTLAVKAGLSERTIARVEYGHTTRYTTLYQIAKTFGVDVRDLM